MSLPNNQATAGNGLQNNHLASGVLPTAPTTYASAAFPGYPYALNPMVYTGAANQLTATTTNSFNYPYQAYQAAAAYNYNYAAYYQQQGLVAPLPAAVVPAINPQSNKAASNNKFPNKTDKKAKQPEQEAEEDDDDDDPTIDTGRKTKANNTLPIFGNEKTMNLNQLILTNILQSPYFKNNLYELKTYHEVIDEIYYQVKHLEPWERGSRKVGGQTGMCGSVRGVGAGGIVSTCFCILYKLYTLKLTRKQLNGLLKHKDSPYIRALGFMYIRFTQPPTDFFKWFEPYLEDKEVIEVKSGLEMTIGELIRQMLTKLDWFSTLLPRIPVPAQKEIESKLHDYDKKMRKSRSAHLEDGELDDEHDRKPKDKVREYKYASSGRSRGRSRSRSRSPRNKSRNASRSRERKYRRSRSPKNRSKERSPRNRSRERSRNHSRDRSRERHRYR